MKRSKQPCPGKKPTEFARTTLSNEFPKHLKDIGRYQVGDAVPLHTENGAQLVTVVKIGHSMVDVDTNHPTPAKP